MASRKSHPFILQLTSLRGARATYIAEGGKNDSRRAEGNKGDPHVSRIYTRINAATMGAILEGKYIPTESEVAQICEDYGFKRGQQDYSNLYALGCEYSETFSPKKKRPAATRTSRPTDPSKMILPAADDIFYPAQPIDLTIRAIYNQLYPPQQSAARYFAHFSRITNLFDLKQYEFRPGLGKVVDDIEQKAMGGDLDAYRALIVAHYDYYSSQEITDAVKRLEKTPTHHIYEALKRAGGRHGRLHRDFTYTPKVLATIAEHLHCTPSQQEMLDNAYKLYKADIAARSDLDLFCKTLHAYRLKQSMTKLEICVQFGKDASEYSTIESGGVSRNQMRQLLAQRKFDSLDAFVSAVEAMPETEASRIGEVKYVSSGNIKPSPIPTESVALTGYLKALLIEPHVLAARLNELPETVMSCTVGQTAKPQTFEKIVQRLGFEDTDDFMNKAADLKAGRAGLQDQPDLIRELSPKRLIKDSGPPIGRGGPK